MNYEIESIRKIPVHGLRAPDLRERAWRDLPSEAFLVKVSNLDGPFEVVCLLGLGIAGVAYERLRVWKNVYPAAGGWDAEVRRVVESALAWWRDDR